MSKAKIVCGFPGVGKSWLFDNQTQLGLAVLDSDSSKFSWSEPGVRNPDFPNNYITHIKENLDMCDFVLVSTHAEVLNALHDNALDAILVYPSIELKDEYIERYRNRGNDEKFIGFIGNNWESFVAALSADSRFSTHYKLSSGEFFSDGIVASVI